MYTVKIMNEFLHGPIWVYNSDGITIRSFPLIYEDTVLKELNDNANEIYTEYYEFDSHDQACWFDCEKEKAEKDIMLEIIRKIVARLNEINDGSFTVEDYETPRLMNL